MLQQGKCKKRKKFVFSLKKDEFPLIRYYITRTKMFTGKDFQQMMKFLTFCGLMLAAFLLVAADPEFRSGTVCAAEITDSAPSVDNNKRSRISNGSWAQMIVRLTPNRKLSVYDFVLLSNGQAYPCVAIAENDDPYDASNWKIENPGTSSLYRMLFQIPRCEEDRTTLELKMNLLPDSSLANDRIEFRKKSSFSSASDFRK